MNSIYGKHFFCRHVSHIPYRLITRMQLRKINGISSAVTSKYSSNEPPKSFGWPVIFIRPIRFRFGTCDLTNNVAFEFEVDSLASSARNNSAFASSRAIRDVPRIYSRIFYKQKKTFQINTGIY